MVATDQRRESCGTLVPDALATVRRWTDLMKVIVGRIEPEGVLENNLERREALRLTRTC